MILILRVLCVMIRGAAHKLRKRRTREAAVVTTLFQPPNFPAAHEAELLRLVRLCWRAFKTVLLGSSDLTAQTTTGSLVLWTGGEPHPQRYVTEYGRETDVSLLNQLSSPNCLSPVARLMAVIFITACCLASLPASLLRGSESSVHRILELARALRILSTVERIRPSRVYFYASYQRYGNLVAYLLSNRETAVVRIPSPNPLSYHYTTCVSDEFVLTSPSQISEYKRLLPNWFVTTVRLWKPPGYVEIPTISYRTADAGAKSIGLLSGGLWRRQELGDLFEGERLRELESEQELHAALGHFLRLRPEVKLTVYPHPKEKANLELYARTVELYRTRIGTDRIQVVPAQERTHHHFHRSDVLVSLWSTSAMEALYCGHKLVIARLNCDANVIDPALARIHVYDRDSLCTKIDEFLSLSCDAYFRQHGLTAFRHDFLSERPVTVTPEFECDRYHQRESHAA